MSKKKNTLSWLRSKESVEPPTEVERRTLADEVADAEPVETTGVAAGEAGGPLAEPPVPEPTDAHSLVARHCQAAGPQVAGCGHRIGQGDTLATLYDENNRPQATLCPSCFALLGRRELR